MPRSDCSALEEMNPKKKNNKKSDKYGQSRLSQAESLYKNEEIGAQKEVIG